MFYISSINGNKLGVTDTKDNVEEFYTKEELADLFYNHRVYIEGFVHTGSGFHVYVKNLSLLKLEKLRNGEVCRINRVLAFKTDSFGDCFFMFLDGEIKRIRACDLLNDKYTISMDNINESNTLILVKDFIKKYPTSHLALWLSSKYNI